MITDSPAQAEDLLPVRSRINWGAILAGAVLALSLYFLLMLLGSAVGLSISDKVDSKGLRIGAIVYAIVITGVSLFVGGYMASQLTTGENKIEGSLYGIFVWATMSALLLALMASGVRMGLQAMTGVAAAADHTRHVDWEASARQAGVPQERIEEWKTKAREVPAATREAAENPQSRKEAADAATRATWYAFFGVWISMMAAAAGGYVGSGPTFHVFSVSAGRIVETRRVAVAPAQ